MDYVDVANKLKKMYRGTITLVKESPCDLYYTCLTPLQSRISIRVNIESKRIYEGNYFKYYLI